MRKKLLFWFRAVKLRFFVFNTITLAWTRIKYGYQRDNLCYGYSIWLTRHFIEVCVLSEGVVRVTVMKLHRKDKTVGTDFNVMVTCGYQDSLGEANKVLKLYGLELICAGNELYLKGRLGRVKFDACFYKDGEKYIPAVVLD